MPVLKANLFLLLFSVLLEGFSSVAKGAVVEEPRSQIQSIAADLAEIAELRKASQQGTLTESQLKEIQNKPYPAAPSQGFEVGLTRRALAAFYRSDFETVHQSFSAAIKSATDQSVVENLAILSANSYVLGGRFQAAIKIMAELENMWKKDSERTGRPMLDSLARVNIVNGANTALAAHATFDETNQFLNRFPNSIDEIAQISLVDKLNYKMLRNLSRAVNLEKSSTTEYTYQELQRV